MCVGGGGVLLASVVNPPSDVNGQFSIYIYLYICNPHCTYCYAVRASNCAYALSRSPIMHSISLVCVRLTFHTHYCC